MGIQLGTGVTQPLVTFNKVFLQHLSIDQYLITDDAPLPKYRVTIEYRLYGVVGGIRHFHPEIREMEVADFLTEAMRQAQGGNVTLLDALPAIEAAIAALVAVNLNTTAQVV